MNALRLDGVRKQLDQLTQERRIVLDVLHDSARVRVDGRPVDVIEGHATFGGIYEYTFEFAIVLDPTAGLIFSFIWHAYD